MPHSAPLPTAEVNSLSVSDVDLPEQPGGPSVQRLPHSASASVTSPQRFSSLGRRSAARLAVNTDLQTPIPLPRAAARDINDELESPTTLQKMNARSERRMSMLDFLVADPSVDASPRLAQASLSAEHLPRSVQAVPSSTPASNSALVPPSMPLMQASRLLRIESNSARPKTLQPKKVDLCNEVRVRVEPLVDRLTMFGSMQSSSNYSLAGTVVLEVPKLNVPRLSSAAGLARDGSTTDFPSIHVDTLTVRFTGYSVYVDATGRFNALKLTEVSQELLPPQGHSCPVQVVGTGEQSTSPQPLSASTASESVAESTLKYETEFDLSIPGWLPASQRSRFGATFYCVQATAVVEGQVVLSAVSGFEALGGDSLVGLSSHVNLAKSLESEVHDATDPKRILHQKDGTRSPPDATARSKTKKTWLNKTAKQLQLRSSRKSTGAEAGQSSRDTLDRRGSGSKDARHILNEDDPLFSKTSEACNQLLPSGQHSVKSESLGILVRRCRDVVPVPVARLARLATASQVMRDAGETPSLSQSMAALARLQGGSDLHVHSQSTPPPLLTGQGRMHLPSSVSAPISLSSRSSAPPSASATDRSAPSSAAINARDTNPDGAAVSSAVPALAPSPRIDEHSRTWGMEPASRASVFDPAQVAQREPDVAMPRAPSAFDAPRDPAKLAAASSNLAPSATVPNLSSSISRSLDPRFGNANSPPRTSSRAMPASRSSAPLRHFVHRPTLHLPPELGVTPDKDAAGGLNFSLTLSLPSHVHVTGPRSDVLSFGVQIEVGRTEGWDVLKKWGGLRLKDMELVCLQTERHSSMPSRSFCATFPVPPMPNSVDAADLPVVTRAKRRPAASNHLEDVLLVAEERLRQSYDRSMVLGHIALVNKGKAPHPIENNVERVRTTIVGPPPFLRQGNDHRDFSCKGKARVGGDAPERPTGSSRSPSQHSLTGSGRNTPDGTSQGANLSSSLRAAFAPAAQVNSGSRASVLQPLPRALARSHNSSSSSLRQAFQGSDGSGSMQARSGAASASLTNGSSATGQVVRTRRPIPFDIGAATATEIMSNGRPLDGPDADTAGPRDAAAASCQAQSRDARRVAHADSDGIAMPNTSTAGSHPSRTGVTSSVSTRSDARPALAPRRGRFETAINRLSTFASLMLEQPNEASASSSSGEARSSRARAPSSGNGEGATSAASLRATYAFSGDDAQGVDLTKGRVRMTINLPLVPNDMDEARKAGSAQLIPDFESPYVRVRHKLKVKLGFGLKSNVASGEDGQDWAQALVMCVPVRFTEAPPKEVQDQFGPVNIQTSTQSGPETVGQGEPSRPMAAGPEANGTESCSEAQHQPDPGLPVPFAEPLLPAYAQLFREDGSRLADEGEDLPRYPGRMSVVGEIDEDLDSVAAVQNGHEAEAVGHLQGGQLLSAVQEDEVPEEVVSNSADASVRVVDSHLEPGSMINLPRTELLTPPRFSSLGSAPASMDRTTSLPGARLLTRAASSGVYGLRVSASPPAVAGASFGVAASRAAEGGDLAGTRSRVGSSAFDPLPIRPGMRRRSATTASLVSFSRIMPAEVLDEALVTSALDDEEDRMDALHNSETLNTLSGRAQEDLEALDDMGQDEDGEEDDEDTDGVGSLETDSEVGHTAVVSRHVHGQLEESGESEGIRGDGEDAEIGMAF